MTETSTGAAAGGRVVVIAAGGTGGHLFPAQSLARDLVERGYRVVLITDERGKTYTDKFPDADIHLVDAATFVGRGPVGKIMAAFSIVSGIVRAWVLLGKLKPAVVVGFGGYPSLPAMVGGVLRGRPTCIHEQNSVLGRVNRFMARRVDIIACAFDKLRGVREGDSDKVSVTGNPVRAEIVKARERAYPSLDSKSPIRLLIIGGSQGARVLSRIVPQAIASLPEPVRARLELTQQCREEDLEGVKKVYEENGVHADLRPFFTDMADQLAAAHLFIGRAGASTVTELGVVGRPGILVPLPAATDDHQFYNAAHLQERGGGWTIREKNFTPEDLRERLLALFETGKELKEAAAAARESGRPDATRRLADIVEGLATNGRAFAGQYLSQSARPKEVES